MAKRARGALPFLLPFAVLLPNLRAAWPDLTYYFRDFTVTFFPLRLFVARELRAGRWPFWNPYVQEGTFAFPAFYPIDLLLALRPTPEFASFLLTLHIPLAALAAYSLARELERSPVGAFATGIAYALGGFALSSLNLYVFLQALAIAPLVVLAFRRAARDGGRAVPLAAITLAAGLSTLAVEFVAQALVLALALALEARCDRRALLRIFAALALGTGLAGLPIALMLGLLPETQRGAGLDASVALANALHPAALLQVLVPGLFGPLDVPPAEAFWGARFFSKGFPYFVSLYLGPLALGLAVAGWGVVARRQRLLVAGLGALGLWFSLGAAFGMAPAILSLPGLHALRFPSKAFFLPHFAVAIFVGAGVDALRANKGVRPLAAVSAGLAVLAGGGSGLALAQPSWVTGAFDLSGVVAPAFAQLIAAELGRAALVAVAGAVLALATRAGRVAPATAGGIACAILLLDLARAGAGLNPQVDPALFEPPQAFRQLGLDRLDGHRLFSYETEQSPAVRSFLSRQPRHAVLNSFILHRLLLAPYTNMIDGVETAWGKDLTSFGGAGLLPEQFDPRRFREIRPLLEQAAVSRVLTLDTIEDASSELLSQMPAGPSGLQLRVYALRDPLPRAYLACRTLIAGDARTALEATLQAGFDGRREVALEEVLQAQCSSGSAGSAADKAPGDVRIETQADGLGVLVLRDSYARGWTARVDSKPARVLRANGKYMAIPVAAGAHSVSVHYSPPGLGWGALVSGAAAAMIAVLLLRPTSTRGL